MQRNVLQIIEKTKGNINPRYDMDLGDMNTIYHSGNHITDIIYNAFRFGYAQGAKAQKKAARKKV